MLLILVPLCVILTIYAIYRRVIVIHVKKNVTAVNGFKLEKLIPIKAGLPILGNFFDIVACDQSDLFQYFRSNTARFKRSYMLRFFSVPVYNIIKAEDAEPFLTNPNLLKKQVVYDLLVDFIGTGLLISTGEKWHSRRKLLTPAFYFSILQNFHAVFMEESVKVVDFLNEQKDGSIVSLSKIVPRFTLNNVCEAALGVKLDELKEKGDNYRQNITEVDKIIMRRVVQILLYDPTVYRYFGEKTILDKFLKKVHDFSSDIIKTRRTLFKSNELKDEYKKPRHAMLDTLLEAEREGKIDHSGICEEVDTFMFEGYDTTSTGLIFTLLLIALHSDVQEKILGEINTFVDDPLNLTLQDLSDLKYLECVIKESLRLYPPVHLIGRQFSEDMTIGNVNFPEGAQIVIHIFDIHRDPQYFPDPEKFDPDRFLPENTTNRHPFAYIPFSAGQRNCIGQRFAMLEMKMLLVNVLKYFKLIPITQREELVLQQGIILRTSTDIKIRIEKRNK